MNIRTEQVVVALGHVSLFYFTYNVGTLSKTTKLKLIEGFIAHCCSEE